MSETAQAKPMSKTERQTLIRLVRQRFRLLHTAVHARRSQLEAAIRQEIRAEHEAEMEAFRERYDSEVLTKVTEMRDALNELTEDMRKAGYTYGNTGWIRDLEYYRNRLTIEPDDLQAQVQERLQEKLGGKPLTQYALELEESKLVEELLVGDLTSDGAQAFLAKVPTAEGLIPLANNGASAAIEAAESI